MSLESVSRLSDLTGFDRRTISKRVDRLLPIKEGKALLYETRDALPLCYQADMGEKQFDLEQERARLAHHQANREAMREAVERGEYLPASIVREYGAAAMTATKTKLLGIASKLRGRFPDVPQSMIDDISTLHREALQELGEDGLHAELRRRLADPSVGAVGDPSA